MSVLWNLLTERIDRHVACATVDGNNPPIMLQAFRRYGDSDESRSSLAILARIYDEQNGISIEMTLDDLEQAVAAIRMDLG